MAKNNKKQRRPGADLAAARGIERRKVIAEGGLHIWRPKARSFEDRAKVADRDACRGRGRGRDGEY